MFFKKFFGGLPFGLFFDEAGSGGAPAPKTFTQDELNRIAGDARADGRSSYENELLKKFGVQNVDEIASLVKAARDAEAQNQSELEKLQKTLADKEKEFDEFKAQAEQTQAALKARILNTEIKIAAQKVVLGDDKKTVVRPVFRTEALDDVIVLIDKKLITEKDDKFEGVDKALDALAKAKPFLLDVPEKPQGKGTPKIKETNGEQKPPVKKSVGNVVRF